MLAGVLWKKEAPSSLLYALASIELSMEPLSKDQIEALPEYVWVRNPKGILVEVKKDQLKFLLKNGFLLVGDDLKNNTLYSQINTPPGEIYLDCEEI